MSLRSSQNDEEYVMFSLLSIFVIHSYPQRDFPSSVEEDPSLSIWLLAAVVALLLCSAFFSAAEVALLSLSPAKVRTMAESQSRTARLVAVLKNRPRQMLITILLGNNVANTALSVLAAAWTAARFGSAALGVVTGVVTMLLLLFGEIVPKNLAHRYSQQMACLAAPVLLALLFALYPLVWALAKLLLLMEPETEHKHFSDEELLALAEIGEEEGQLQAPERQRIEGVLDFSERTAAEVMTPRTNIDALEEGETLASAVKFFLEKTHSRIPVFRGDTDGITGILTLKNLLSLEQSRPADTPLAKISLKTALRVPESMPLENVFKEMKKARTHMAIVVDEHGGTAGLVTLEDLLEEVFGEIRDETDRETEEIQRVAGGFLVRGSALLHDVRSATGQDIGGEGDERIAAVVLAHLGRFPKEGELVELPPGIAVRVERMAADHRIETLKIPAPTPAQDA